MAGLASDDIGPHCLLVPPPARTDFDRAAQNRLNFPFSSYFRRSATQEPYTAFHFFDDEEDLPSSWQRGVFKFNDDAYIPFYISRAQNERAVIGLGSGMKGDHAVTPDMVEDYNKKGLSVIWINLPNPGRSRGMMPFYRALLHKFYTDKNSPFYTEFDENLPRLIEGHSTSGGIITDLVTDPKTKHEYTHIPLGIAEAGFFDNANASRDDGWLTRNVFTAYATWHKNKLPHETLGGLFYLNYSALSDKLTDVKPLPDASKIEKISFTACKWLYTGVCTVRNYVENKYYTHTFNSSAFGSLRRYFYAPALDLINQIPALRDGLGNIIDTSYMTEMGTPTYGQILEIRNTHRKVTDRIVNEGAKPSTKMIFVAGDEDPFSANLPQRQIAEATKSEFIEAKAQHRPLHQDPQTRQIVLDEIDSVLPEEVSPASLENSGKRSLSYFPPVAAAWVHLPKIRTGFRNVAARLTQRFLGNSTKDQTPQAATLEAPERAPQAF